MQSNSIGNLAGALAKAQAKIRGAVKDSANPFFKSSYADLQSVWDACRGPLTENGLCVIQTTESTEAGCNLLTTLAHESGEFVTGRLPVLPLKNEPQALGSAISYALRYALAALVGVYQTDDDAEQAQARGSVNTAPRQVVAQAATKINEVVKATNTVTPKTPEQAVIAATIDKELTRTTGKLGAPFDLVIKNGKHAGKQIQDLTNQEAREYFQFIQDELKSLNRSPATLRGPGRDVYLALEQYCSMSGG